MVSTAAAPFVALKRLHTGDEFLDEETRKQRRGCLHALVMLTCLTVLLGVIYYSQEPYRYVVSTKAFKETLHLSALQEEDDLDVTDVWRWFDELLDELGGESTKSVKLNCAYDDKKSQKVRIDGVDYFLVDPANDESACTKIGYIDGADDGVYLAGVHEILSFGAFTTRSKLDNPIKGAVSPVRRSSIRVTDSAETKVSPFTDDRIVKTCEMTGAESNVYPYCIAEDDFRGSITSTFHWAGE